MDPLVIHDHSTLWGLAGGQLEFVSLRDEGKEVVLTFTDHDVQAHPDPRLKDGKYYVMRIPKADV